jgi:[CysO sulfur-carrier protein]-S-L-cysteine hydrolase
VPLKIPKELIDEIVAHARDAHPNESCGILAGKNSVPTHIYKMKNADPNPRIRYLMETQEQFWAFKNMRHNGLEVIAIYHSHPHTEAYPSPTDVKLAYYPEAYYILTSLQEPQNPVVRSFRILDGKITEEPIEKY